MFYKDEVITVRFDKEMLKGFTGYDTENPEEYFKYHPRAKKPPMESLWKKSRNGLVPSVNTFLNCNNRVIQNSWEQHLKEYCEYCMQQQGIKHSLRTGFRLRRCPQTGFLQLSCRKLLARAPGGKGANQPNGFDTSAAYQASAAPA